VKRSILPFVVGLLLGALLTVVIQCHFRHGAEHRPTAAKVTDRLAHALKLAPDQKDKVQSIIDDSFKRMTALREQVRPQFKDIRESARLAIRQILNPDQQAKFDRISQEQEKRLERKYDDSH